MFLDDASGGKRVISAAALCFTDQGQQAAERIGGLEIFRSGRDFTDARKKTEALFSGPDRVRLLVFFSAAGIAVRMLAPYIKDKMTDPAVIVVNDTAEYVIPILSGHAGMANELALRLAETLGALPVITTASDHRTAVDAPDLWAAREGYTVSDRNEVRKVTAAMLAGRPVERFCCGEDVVWKTSDEGSGNESLNVLMSPRKYVVGLGCRKGIDPLALKAFVKAKLAEAGILEKDIFKICSIERKAGERALVHLARDLNRPFVVFTAEQMNALEGSFFSSDFVRNTTGTDNVCERSAIAGCGPAGGRLSVRRQAEEGMTFALAERFLPVRNAWAGGIARLPE